MATFIKLSDTEYLDLNTGIRVSHYIPQDTSDVPQARVYIAGELAYRYIGAERDALLAAVQGGQTDVQAEFAVRLTNENKALRSELVKVRGLLDSVDQCAPMEVATHLGDDYPNLADAINSVRDYLAEAVS